MKKKSKTQKINHRANNLRAAENTQQVKSKTQIKKEKKRIKEDETKKLKREVRKLKRDQTIVGSIIDKSRKNNNTTNNYYRETNNGYNSNFSSYMKIMGFPKKTCMTYKAKTYFILTKKLFRMI